MEHHLDCRGIKCPMPIVRIAQKFKDMSAGDRLSVQASDPAFDPDLRAWAASTGNQIVSFDDGETQLAVLRKAR